MVFAVSDWSYLISCVWLIAAGVDAKRSLSVPVPGSYCSHYITEIDGAHLYSTYEKLYKSHACVLRFQSDDDLLTSKRIMINFNRYNVTECAHFSLKIYFRPDASGIPDWTFTCSSPKPPMLYSTGRYVTMRLDKDALTGYDFDIVLTTYKPVSYCNEFSCRNGKCIDRDLKCDGVDHCFDGSDEAPSMSCYGTPHTNVYHGPGRSPLRWIMSVLSFFMLVLFIVCAVGTYRFRRRRAMMTQGQIIQLQQPIYQPPDASTTIVTSYPPSFPPSQPPPTMGYYAGPPPMQQPPAYQPPPYDQLPPSAAYPKQPMYPGYPYPTQQA